MLNQSQLKNKKLLFASLWAENKFYGGYHYWYHSFKKFDSEKFASLLVIDPIMVRKNYFLNNVSKFRKLINNCNSQIINEKNLIFVSILPIRIKESKIIDYPSMVNAYEMKFLENLYLLVHQKKIFSSSYPFKLFFSALNEKLFILQYLFGFLYNQKRFSTSVSAYKNDN